MWRRLPQAPLVAGPCTGTQASRDGSGGRGASSQRGADARALRGAGARRGPRGQRLFQSRFTFADTWVSFCRQRVLRRHAGTRGMREGAADYACLEKAARRSRFKPLPTRTLPAKAELGEREGLRSLALSQAAEIFPVAPRSVRRGARVSPGRAAAKGASPPRPARTRALQSERSGGRASTRAPTGQGPAGAGRAPRARKWAEEGTSGGGRGAKKRRRRPGQNCGPGRARGPEAAAGGRQSAEVSGQ